MRYLRTTRHRMRALQRYTVQVPRVWVNAWQQTGAARDVHGVIVVDFPGAYDERFGLRPDRIALPVPSTLVV